MKKIIQSVAISLLLLFSMTQQIGQVRAARTPAAYPYVSAGLKTGSMRFVINSTVRLINHGTSVWQLTEEERSIDLFMNNTRQTVILINQSHPLETFTEDDDGNLMALLGMPERVDPGEETCYSVSYHILSKPVTIPDLSESASGELQDIPENLKILHCVPQPLFPVGDEDIVETASEIAANETNVLKIVYKFVEWMWENIRYPTLSHEIPYYPDETLMTMEGDCDEQAMLFATFCRIYGIPSFLQLGCGYLPEYSANETCWNGNYQYELRRIGWHGWAVVYVPPWGWLPVDLTYVTEGCYDPANAIDSGAITLQEFVQYANISRTDYIASSETYMEFLLQNDFCLYAIDEMTKTFLGDLNCDLAVTIQDIQTVAKAFGSRSAHQKWNPIADLDENGHINIADIAIVASEIGKKL